MPSLALTSAGAVENDYGCVGIKTSLGNEAKDSVQFRMNSSGEVTETKPYAPNRPAYGEGQVEKVWENAKQPDGKVYDLNTSEELTWDRTKSRSG